MIDIGKDFAKLTGELTKGIKFGEATVEIKLTFPLKAALPHLVYLSNNQGDELNVFLGYPQMAFDFEEDEDEAYKLYQGGRRVTADASGVVTTVEQPDEQKDENQAELDLDESGSEGFAEHSGGQVKDPAGDPPPEVEEDELNDYEKEIMGEGSKQEGSDLPEWMQEQQQADEPDGHEMTFEDADQEPAANENSETEESRASSDEEISKEELEEYILAQRPSLPDHPLDFPELLKRKRTEEATWRNGVA
ncbi:hypothetical protein SAMN04488688_10432 [Paenibacillus sp. cl141a]|uniref:hypothetical protein n=1 Tax=Paenibacillus sp. cl141a TaxID=1761877 RepID=UPI0008D1D58B|nr:hypothetical protein [Paenibacillus sp. cl141a]SEL43772.1 hypothetical protein SAMN04488688_10432 [Paenibacillus sp. cl141a]